MELPIELLEILNYQLSLIKEDKENNNNNFNQYNQFLFKLPLFLLFNLSIEASKEEEGGSLSHETINLVNNLLVNTLSNSKRPIKLPPDFDLNSILESLYEEHLKKLELIIIKPIEKTTTTTNLLKYLNSLKELELNLELELNMVKASSLQAYNSLLIPIQIQLKPNLNLIKNKINLLNSTFKTSNLKLNLLNFNLEHNSLLTSNGFNIMKELIELNLKESKKLEIEILNFKIELNKYEKQFEFLSELEGNQPNSMVEGKVGKKVGEKVALKKNKSEYETISNLYQILDKEEFELKLDLKRLGWKDQRN